MRSLQVASLVAIVFAAICPLFAQVIARDMATISATSIEGFAEHGGSHFDGCRNIGTLWNTHVGSFSYFPADPAEMARKVAILHDADWQTVLSYYAMNMTQTGTPDFVVNEREWRRDPYFEASLRDGAYGAVCQASSWADMLLWIIDRTMDETGTDGVYVDCSNPRFCRSREHGCEHGRSSMTSSACPRGCRGTRRCCCTTS